MDEHPARGHAAASATPAINVCMRLVKEGKADAVVTAGHTGAGVASAILNLGRLKGVDRPALAVQLVTDKGPMVLLDIGATTDSTGSNLYQYAQMGTIFAEQVLGVTNPSVALLCIGEEGGKGEQRVQEATELLHGKRLHFVGNAEGKDLPKHPADVVVCDASVGNVTIKFFEGLSTLHLRPVRASSSNARRWGPIGYFFMRPGIARIRQRFDYERLGGSPLLGVKGTVLITHGRATRRMIGFAVEVGAAAARGAHPGPDRRCSRLTSATQSAATRVHDEATRGTAAGAGGACSRPTSASTPRTRCSSGASGTSRPRRSWHRSPATSSRP